MARLKRLAVADAQRAGSAPLTHIDTLTDAKLVDEAEASDRAAREALRAAG